MPPPDATGHVAPIGFVWYDEDGFFWSKPPDQGGEIWGKGGVWGVRPRPVEPPTAESPTAEPPPARPQPRRRGRWGAPPPDATGHVAPVLVWYDEDGSFWTKPPDEGGEALGTPDGWGIPEPTYSDERERQHREYLRRLSREHDEARGGRAQPPRRPGRMGGGRTVRGYREDAELARQHLRELTGWFDTFARHRWEDALNEAERMIRIYEANRPLGLDVAERAVNDAFDEERRTTYIEGGRRLLGDGVSLGVLEPLGALADTPIGQSVAAWLMAKAGAVADWIGSLGTGTAEEIEAVLARADSVARVSRNANVLTPWNGDPKTIAKEMIAGRRRVPSGDAEHVSRLYAKWTRAAIGEEAAWKKAVFVDGEIGLQAPGNANAKGVDFITARSHDGVIEIVITDVKTTTTGVAQPIRADIPDAWMAEAERAVAGVDIGDPVLEAEIRAALDAGRVRLRRVVVDYSPAGQGAIRAD